MKFRRFSTNIEIQIIYARPRAPSVIGRANHCSNHRSSVIRPRRSPQSTENIGGPTRVELGTGKSLFPCLIPSLRARFRNPQAMPSVTASSGRHRPAVNDVFGARNGAGARGSNKRDKINDFFGFGWATERYSTEPLPRPDPRPWCRPSRARACPQVRDNRS
jgi:hypothetical protein